MAFFRLIKNDTFSHSKSTSFQILPGFSTLIIGKAITGAHGGVLAKLQNQV